MEEFFSVSLPKTTATIRKQFLVLSMFLCFVHGQFCSGPELQASLGCCFQDYNLSTISHLQCNVQRRTFEIQDKCVAPGEWLIKNSNTCDLQYDWKADTCHVQSWIWTCVDQKRINKTDVEQAATVIFEPAIEDPIYIFKNETDDKFRLTCHLVNANPDPKPFLVDNTHYNDVILESSINKTTPDDQGWTNQTVAYVINVANLSSQLDLTMVVIQYGFDNRTFAITIMVFQDREPEDEGSNVGLIVGILFLCLALSIAISVFFCYHRDLLCFGNRKRSNQDFDLSNAMSRVPVQQNPTSVNGVSNANFNNEEDTYQEIDLSDNPIQARPMSSYVAMVSARYTQAGGSSNQAEVNLYPVTIDRQGSRDDDFAWTEEVPDTGRCRSLEGFDPNSFRGIPGLLEVIKGEELSIVQKDLGSGWTCVRGHKGTGFVPTPILYVL